MDFMEPTKTRNVELWLHTTSGVAFEIIDADTRESLTDGRVYWCDDEADREEEGFMYFREKIAEKGWTIVQECWS